MRTKFDPGAVPFLRVFVQPFRRRDTKGLFFLTAVSFLLFCLALCFQTNGSYDTDGWFLLATGRHIVEHGIPYVNPWSLDPSRPIVVQQWLHDVILFEFWKAFGFAGTIIYQCLMAIMVIASLVYAVNGIRPGGMNFRYLMFSIAVGMSGAGLYISVRPTPWTMAAFLATIGICARWRRCRDNRLLVALPLIALVHVQMQSAMLALDIFAAACFLADPALDFIRKRTFSAFRDSVRTTVPLLLAILSMAVASLVNPYGLEGALYVFTGMGAASYGDVISEMQGAIRATKGAGIAFLLLYISLPLFFFKKVRKGDDLLPLLLLLAAALVATLMHWRNIWILALASSLLTASGMPAADTHAERTLSLFPLLVMSVGAVLLANALPAMGNGWRTEWQVVDDALTPIAESVAKSGEKDPKVYSVDPFAYNYLEWKGLKIPFDLRPEIWDERASDGTVVSPYRDYVDSLSSASALRAYLKNGDFDFFIVPFYDVSKYADTVPMHRVSSSEGYVLMQKGLR